MTTSYFTLGQSHQHNLGGLLLDKDTIVKITAESPREVMIAMFGTIWGNEYPELSKDMVKYWPEYSTLVSITINASNLHSSL